MTAPEENWYLQEWMTHFRKRQAALVNELGWDKATANFVWHGERPYSRKWVNQIANWLGIRPFELLMPPQEALALRRIRQTAALIVAEGAATFEGEPPTPPAPTTGR